MLEALSRWATIERAAKLADLAVKLSAIIVALLAANFFLLRPDVQTTSLLTQRRVDPNEIRQIYAATQTPVPALVERTIAGYENDQQLYLSTLQIRPSINEQLANSICEFAAHLIPEDYFTPSRSTLCGSDRQILAEIAQEHELRLLQNHGLARTQPQQAQESLAPDGKPKITPLTEAQLVEALNATRDATYFIEVYKITNEGRAAAEPVRVVPPGGYTQTSEEPLVAPLSPGNQRIYEFRTDQPPRSQIEVSWDSRPSDPANTPVMILLIAFAVLVAAIVVNDLYRTTKNDGTHDEAETPSAERG